MVKKKRRVFISGASGFIGANVLRYMLKHTEWEFVCVASWRHRGNPMRLQDVDKDRVTVITHDLTGTIPYLGTYDYMLHFASESHVDRSIQDPVSFIENNIAITLNMLEYARAHTPRVFLQFSTDEVYGSNEGEDVEEADWATILPSNPYAASKAAQEAIAIAYWRTYGVPILITNSNNIIGPGQDEEKYIPRIINAISYGGKLTVHTHNGEMGQRFYNPVDNVSDAIMFLLERYDQIKKPDRPPRFNLGGGKELSNLAVAEIVANLLDKPLDYILTEVGNLRPGYDKRYFSNDKPLADLGWVPPISFEEGLQEVIEGLKLNGTT